MGLITLLLLAVGLSMDAFAVSVCKGLAMQRISFKGCAICGIWFGGFQMLMPMGGSSLRSVRGMMKRRFSERIKGEAPFYFNHFRYQILAILYATFRVRAISYR